MKIDRFYYRMGTLLLILVGLMLCSKSHGQSPVIGEKPAPLIVLGYPGTPVTRVLQFPGSVPTPVTAAVYQVGTTTKLVGKQPTVTTGATSVTVTWPMPTSQLEWTGYHEISWGGSAKIAGRITSSRTATSGTIPTATTLTVGLASPVTVQVGTVYDAPLAQQASQIAALLAADEPGVKVYATYAAAVAGLTGRTRPARVLILADEVNNAGGFGKYDWTGTTLIEDLL